jgi:hypothetical protein
MPHPNPSAHVVCYNGKSYEWGGVTFPEKINDWKFSIIDPDQSDTDYWNQEADKIIAAGSIRVTVANAEWRA